MDLRTLAIQVYRNLLNPAHCPHLQMFLVRSLSQSIHFLHCLMNLHLLCCLDDFCQSRTDFRQPTMKTQIRVSLIGTSVLTIQKNLAEIKLN